MTDLRSGLCHGPTCQAKITDGGGSEDFCGHDCQTRWHAQHALPHMPGAIQLPASSLARWTPEGGAPVTPETSTWTPTRLDVADVARLFGVPRDLIEGPEVGEAATQWPIKDPGPTRDDLIAAAGSIDAARSLGLHFWKVDVTEPEDVVCLVCGHPYVGGGPIPTRCTPPKRSWLSRIWRCIHG